MKKKTALYILHSKRAIYNPAFIFAFVWAVSLIAYLITQEISYSYNKNIILLLAIASLSLLVFFSTFCFCSLFMGKSNRSNSIIQIDLRQDRINFLINYILVPFILVIVLYNILFEGNLPVLSYFGIPSPLYLTYGRFKAFLIPLINIVVVLGIFSGNRFKRHLLFVMGLMILLAFVMRGPAIIMIFQYVIIVNLINTRNKYVYLKALLFLLFIILFMAIGGSIRTGSDQFMKFFNIKEEYRYINIGILWVLTYVSGSFSDFLSIVESVDKLDLTLGKGILASSLPAFVSPSIMDERSIVSDLNLIDGVYTYLGSSFLDFSYLGIIFINMLFGILSAVYSYTTYFKKNFFISAWFFTILYFMFFVDYLFYFGVGVQLIIGMLVFKFICVSSKVQIAK